MGREYLGHESQMYGVEEVRLSGGRGDGVRMLQVRNGRGLALSVCLDRCADIYRLEYRGVNCGFLSPCGVVAPQYYNRRGTGFLDSFTAGFLTTCGLSAVGAACEDGGEELPMHGDISHCPAEWAAWEVEGEWIRIRTRMDPSRLFGDKLVLERSLLVSLESNRIRLEDRVSNRGDRESPLMVLYHFNLGYPLLEERALLHIPSSRVEPRNDRAAVGLEEWAAIAPPTPGFEEQCYYHSFEGGEGLAALYNPVLTQGLSLRFDAEALDHFVQWKMTGVRDYALGLEPANCHCDGRDRMRRESKLRFLAPGQEQTFRVEIDALEEGSWRQLTAGV